MKKVKHPTNIQLITGLMCDSQQGVLMQAFLIEAIHAYAKQVKASKSNPEWAAQAFISWQSWCACADEALEAINNRSK
jgi:accessory colonization factor AcfC